MEIRSRTVSEAWPKILRRIVDFGGVKYLPHHDQYVLELDEPIVVSMSHPTIDMIPRESGWNIQTLDLYAQQFLIPTNDGFTYTYGERIFNQVEHAITKLSHDPTSRQSIAVAWIKDRDPYMNYPPCMIVMDFKIYDDKLTTTVYFRSNDMYMAWPQNVYGIIAVMKYVAMQLGIAVGRLTTISNAPHIYISLLRDAMIASGIMGRELDNRYNTIVNESYDGFKMPEGAVP